MSVVHSGHLHVKSVGNRPCSPDDQNLSRLRQKVIYLTERCACLSGYKDNSAECQQVQGPALPSHDVFTCSYNHDIQEQLNTIVR